jgi:hypothetical protein
MVRVGGKAARCVANMRSLLFILVGTAFIFAVFLIQRRQTNTLQKVSDEIGFVLVDRDNGVPRPKNTPGDYVRNVMRGKAGGFDAVLYDCVYMAGSTPQTTVAAFKLHDWPARFELHTATFVYKAGTRGPKDIDLKSNPNFSKRYRLRGDEQQIRKLFNSNLQMFFEQLESGWSVETSGQWLMAYRRYKHVRRKADQFRHFLDTAASIATSVNRKQS